MGKSMLDEVIRAITDGRYEEATALILNQAFKSTKSLDEAIYSSLNMLTAGFSMLLDDIKDLGKVDRPHHWMWGLMLAVAGATLLGLLLLFWGSGEEE